MECHSPRARLSPLLCLHSPSASERPCCTKATPAKISTATSPLGQANFQWQWKMHWLSQRQPNPSLSHCPGVPLELLMFPRDPAELFVFCGLHHHVAAHNPSQMHTELMFSFFFLVKVAKGAVCTFLFHCTPTFLYYFTAPVLQRRIATVHQSSPLHNSTDMVVHGGIFNTSHVIRKGICKRFEGKGFRPVMYLKRVLQQGVPKHSSTKRSQPSPSGNCLVQVVEAEAQSLWFGANTKDSRLQSL